MSGTRGEPVGQGSAAQRLTTRQSAAQGLTAQESTARQTTTRQSVKQPATQQSTARQTIMCRDARKLFLHQQGLMKKNQFGTDKKAVLTCIQNLSYLQIDTISVVRRAHEHILATRVGNFDARMLTDLHKHCQIFEYWGHAAAYLPFEHYRFYLPVMHGWASTHKTDKRLAAHILKRIKTEGPLQSKDFKDSRKNKQGGWWEWKPAKHVLEHLFLTGELMVTHREGFQKVYDLRDRVLPSDTDTRMPSREEWAQFIVQTMVQALGIATEQDLGYARGSIRQLSGVQLKEDIRTAIEQLTEAGELVPVSLDGGMYNKRRASEGLHDKVRSSIGLDDKGLHDKAPYYKTLYYTTPYYTTPRLLSLLPIKLGKRNVRILSPFDNLVINRQRTKALFDFDYQLECYLPAEKRKYGYFSLPVLWGDLLVGRLDAKADRKAKVLIVKHLVLEDEKDNNRTLCTSPR